MNQDQKATEEPIVDKTPPDMENGAVLRINGSLSSTSAVKLRQYVETFRRKKVCEVYIDLAGMDFIDSAGIGSIVSLAIDLRNREGRLVLTGPNARVRRIFQVVKIEKVAEIVDELEV